MPSSAKCLARPARISLRCGATSARASLGSSAADAESQTQTRLDAYTTEGEPFIERFPDRHLVIEVRANRMPDGGLVITFSDVTPSFEAAEALACKLVHKVVPDSHAEALALARVLARNSPKAVALTKKLVLADRAERISFFHAMLKAGVYLAPSAFEAGFISITHSDEIIDATLDAAKGAFAQSKG